MSAMFYIRCGLWFNPLLLLDFRQYGGKLSYIYDVSNNVLESECDEVESCSYPGGDWVLNPKALLPFSWARKG